MTVGYECWKKGIRVPSRGATTRSGGVRYRYLNMRERGKCSGDRVGGGGVGRIRRRDGLMFSQATVRSYTKDRAVLRWDHTLKRGRV